MTRLEVHIAGQWHRVTVTREPVVCGVCNDTHQMPLGERMVMCTRCPTPCEACRSGRGAYCTVPACKCACHAGTYDGELIARASWAGRTDDGCLVVWTAADETRAIETPGYHAEEFIGYEHGCDRCDIVHELLWRGDNRGTVVTLVRRLHAEHQLAMHFGREACETLSKTRALLHEVMDRSREWAERVDACRLEVADTAARNGAAYREITRLRDALAVAQHRSEIERDVIEAAEALHTDAWTPDVGRRFDDACRVLIEAERAKEGG